jgi:hypothetical protein
LHVQTAARFRDDVLGTETGIATTIGATVVELRAMRVPFFMG